MSPSRHSLILKVAAVTAIAITAQFVLPAVAAATANPNWTQSLYPLGDVYYSTSPGSAATLGDSTSPNAFATAYAWRSNKGAYGPTDGLGEALAPDPGGRIFAPGETKPAAYYQWDASAQWTSAEPISATNLDVGMAVALTNGPGNMLRDNPPTNGWTGSGTWVGGAQSQVLDNDLVSGGAVNFPDIVMEQIPTPVFESASVNATTGLSTITVSFLGMKGQWANTNTNYSDSHGSGTPVQPINGYSIYRQDGSDPFTFLNDNIGQKSSTTLRYSDTTVQPGHTYRYELGVHFLWAQHQKDTSNPTSDPYPTAGNWFEPAAQGTPSDVMHTGVAPPFKLEFSAPTVTTVAGVNSAVQTVQVEDSSGSAYTPTGSEAFNVNLNTDSSGSQHHFYSSADTTSCTGPAITSSVTIDAAHPTRQFCYYDELAGSATLTASDAALTNQLNPSGPEVATTTPGPFANIELTLATQQSNRKLFAGTNTITAQDVYLNPIPNFDVASNPITLSITAGPPLTTLGVLGDSGGQLVKADFASGGGATANLTGKLLLSGKTGAYTITAKAGASGPSQSYGINLLVGDLSQFSFNLTSPQVVSIPFSTLHPGSSITAEDADGNPFTLFNASTDPVTIRESGGSGTVSGLDAGTAINSPGAFNSTTGAASLDSMSYIGTDTVTHNFTATSESGVTGTSNDVTFTQGPFATVRLVLPTNTDGTPTPQINDTPFSSATLTLLDAGGNPVTGFTGFIDITAPGATISNGHILASQFNSGVAAISGLSYKGPMGSVVFTATDSTGVMRGTTAGNIVHGGIKAIKIVSDTAGPGAEVVSDTLTTDAPITLYSAGYDVSNNWSGLVQSNWVVTGGLFPSTGSPSPESSFTFTPTKATTGSITATSSPDGYTATAAITVNPGALASFAFALNTSQANATPFTPIAIGTPDTLTALDSHGNPITSYSSDTSIRESTGNGAVSGVGSGDNTVLGTSFLSGVAIITGMIYTGFGTPHRFTATGGGKTGSSNPVTFSSGPLASFGLVLNSSQMSGSPFTTATITALDISGNPVTDYKSNLTDTVSIKPTSGLGTVAGGTVAAGIFDSFGVANLPGVTYTGPAGAILFTATSTPSGKTVTAPISVTISAGPVTRVQIVDRGSGTPLPMTSTPAKSGVPLTLWAAGYDTSGNYTGSLSGGTWSSDGLFLRVSGSGSSVIFTPTTAPADGHIIFTYPGPLSSSDSVHVDPGTVSKFAVIPPPGGIVAGQPFSITLQAQDAAGNSVAYTGSPVSLTFGGPGNANGVPPTYPTGPPSFNGEGMAIVGPITLVLAQSVGLVVTERSSAGTTTTSVTVVVTAAGATKFVVGAGAAEIAGAPFTVNLTAVDDFGNTDPSYHRTQQVTFSGPDNSPNGTPPTKTMPVSFTTGQGTANAVTLYDRQNKPLTATADAVHGTTPSGIAVAAGAPYTITKVAGDVQSGSVSQVLALAPQVHVQDQYGNDNDNTTVLFAVGPGGGSVDLTSVSTSSVGTAMVRWTLGPLPVAQTLVASVAGVAAQVTFNATAVSNRLVFVPGTNPIGTQVAGRPFSVSIELVDDNNARVPYSSPSPPERMDFSGPTALALDGSAPSYPTTSVIFTDGYATLSSIVLVAAQESTQLILHSSIGGGTSNLFKVTVGLPTKLAFVTDPQTVGVDVVSAPFTVCVEDQYGNIDLGGVSGLSVTISTFGRAGTFSAVDPGGTWSKTLALFIPTSACISTIYYRDADPTPGPSTIEATSAPLTPGTQPVMQNGKTSGTTSTSTSTTSTTTGPTSTSSTPGPTTVPPTTTTTVAPTTTTTSPPPELSKLEYRSGTLPLTAGVTSGHLTVRSEDASGAAFNVTGATTVTLGSTSSGGLFYSTSDGCTLAVRSIVIPSGSSTGDFCYSDTVAGTSSLTAGSGALTSAQFTANVKANPALGRLTLYLDGQTQADGAPFQGVNTLTAADQYGNTITDYTPATTPTFTLTPMSGATAALTGSAGPFADGRSTLDDLTLTGKAGTYSLTVAADSISSNDAPVTLGAGTLTHFDFALNETSQVIAVPFASDGTLTNTLTAKDADENTVTTFDAASNPVTVTESLSSGAVTGLGGSNVMGTDIFHDGVADLTGFMTYTGSIGRHTFLATAGTITGSSGPVTFTAGPLASFSLSLNDPQADGVPFAATATITALDAGHNTATGFDASTDPVTVTAPSDGRLTSGGDPLGGGSFINGVATLDGAPNPVLIYTGASGSQLFTVASESGKTGTQTVVITNTVATISIVDGYTWDANKVTSSTLTADGNLPLWVAGYDASGNWAGLVAGNWTSTGLATAVTGTGVDHITYTPTTAPASGTITVRYGTLTAPDKVTLTVGALARFVITAPSTAIAGRPFSTVQIQAVDADGNKVLYTGAPALVFSGPGAASNTAAIPSAPVYPATVSFGSGGLATAVPVTLVKAETVAITATLGAVSGTSGPIVVSAAAAMTLGVIPPSTATAGTAFPVTLDALDQFGNLDLTYKGLQTVKFKGPANAPLLKPPTYPAGAVTFAAGTAAPSVTLYDRQSTTLSAVIGTTMTGTSGPIGVSAGAAFLIANDTSSVLSQAGATSQRAPIAPVVLVTDTYGNAKDGYSVAFAIATGGGSVSAGAVTTDTLGNATVIWTLGPQAGGNTLKATGGDSPLTSSVLYTASATPDHFSIVFPPQVTAGVPFQPVSITLLDGFGQTVTTYSAADTVTFVGAGNSANGTPPVFPATIVFVNGVAVPPPSITLFAPGPTGITLSDPLQAGLGTSVGTVTFTVVGVAAQLAITTPAQSISSSTVSTVITVCTSDSYGNSVLASTPLLLNLSSTSSSGQFAAHSQGAWPMTTATIAPGLNCANFYYRDAGATSSINTIQVTAASLQTASQDIQSTGTPPLPINPPTTSSVPPPPTTPSITGAPPRTNPPPESAPNNSGRNNGNQNSTTQNNAGTNASPSVNVTVYVNQPTQSVSQPIASPTIQIAIPVATFPIITSPREGALITPVANYVYVSGTGPPDGAETLVAASGAILAATTSDHDGNWLIVVASSRFHGSQQTIHAQVLHGARSATVTFSFKKDTLLEKVLRFLDVVGPTRAHPPSRSPSSSRRGPVGV